MTRREPGRFDDLLSEADVERLVCSGAIRYPAFRLVREGAQLALGDYVEDIPWRPPFTGAARVGRVLSEWEAGATLVLQGLHLNWLPVAAFCRELERSLGHPVQTNAYYTPPGSQGFAVHHDTHDVFVLQVAGEKRWFVYEPVLELPLKGQRYSKELGAPAEPSHELTLRAGDTLYLPRGWLHEALTSDSESLHLTVGVNVYSWTDAVKAALESLADDVEFRRAVPPDGEGGAKLLERLRERLDPEEVSKRMRRRLVRTRRPILDGQLTQLRALERLDGDTVLERRPTVIAELEAGDGGVKLVFEGKELLFPAHATAEVEFCAESLEPFTADDMPGELDDEGRLVLARRLVREGFLRVRDVSRDAPSPSSDGASGA